MKTSKIFVTVLITLFLSYHYAEAKSKAKVRSDISRYIYVNYEVVGVEVKHLRHGVNISVGINPMFQSAEFEVFNVRPNEAISLDYHHYLIDSEEKRIYVGAGYFVRGNLFGKRTDTLEELKNKGATSSKREVNVPLYAIVGEKIAIGRFGFIDMHIRINERISPSIFFGLRF